MDALITAAARALAAGDPLGALKRVALRDDAPALALRGIAMAQLGDLVCARALLRRAARGFGHREQLSRARCIVAEAEIALASRDLGWSPKALAAARSTLDAHGDRLNAAHASCIDARRLLLIGQVNLAEQSLAAIDPGPLPPALQAVKELVSTGIAVRRLEARRARAAIARAWSAAHAAGIPALMAELDAVRDALDAPAARLLEGGRQRTLVLDDVEALLASPAVIIDACRHAVRCEQTTVPMATRPVLFALARALGEAWPSDVSRATLITRAFEGKAADESHRARLRVEIGRLRAMLGPITQVTATKAGFRLTPGGARSVVVLTPPVEAQHAAVLALLADGESWSSSALALALGVGQRTVQRALESLADAERVQAFGRGRARRWTMAPVAGFTTALLLPSPLPV